MHRHPVEGGGSGTGEDVEPFCVVDVREDRIVSSGASTLTIVRAASAALRDRWIVV
jgi:hypothetical protein